MCDGPLQHGASGCLMVAVQAPKCRFLLLSVSNRTVLASTGNTSALLAQRVNLTHSNEIALFYHPICSAQRPLVSPPLPQFEEDLLFPCRDIVLCECINGGDYAAERFFFFSTWCICISSAIALLHIKYWPPISLPPSPPFGARASELFAIPEPCFPQRVPAQSFDLWKLEFLQR